MALTINTADLIYASRLMILGMGAVFLVIAIMVIIVNLMKNFLADPVPSPKKTAVSDDISIPLSSNENKIETNVDTNLTPAAQSPPKTAEPITNKSSIPIEVITAAIAMYLTLEQETRSQSNV